MLHAPYPVLPSARGGISHADYGDKSDAYHKGLAVVSSGYSLGGKPGVSGSLPGGSPWVGSPSVLQQPYEAGSVL